MTIGFFGSRWSSGGSLPALTRSASMGASLYKETGAVVAAGAVVAPGAAVAAGPAAVGAGGTGVFAGAGVLAGADGLQAAINAPPAASADSCRNLRREISRFKAPPVEN